jgi:hypothetical protein
VCVNRERERENGKEKREKREEKKKGDLRLKKIKEAIGFSNIAFISVVFVYFRY